MEMDIDDTCTNVSPSKSEEIILLGSEDEDDNITVVIRKMEDGGHRQPSPSKSGLPVALKPRTCNDSLSEDSLRPLAISPEKGGKTKGVGSTVPKKARSRPRHQRLAAKQHSSAVPVAQSTPTQSKRGRDQGGTPSSGEQPIRKKVLQPSVATFAAQDVRLTDRANMATLMPPTVLVTTTTVASPTDMETDETATMAIAEPSHTATCSAPTITSTAATTDKLSAVISDATVAATIETAAPQSSLDKVTKPDSMPDGMVDNNQTTASTSNMAPPANTDTASTTETATSSGSGSHVAPGTSYAEKTAECDLIMAIIDRRQPNGITALTPERHTRLLRCLSDLANTMSTKGTNPPAILDNRLAGGSMRIKCFDAYARHWLERMVPKIDGNLLWKEANLEVIEFSQIPKPQKVVGWFPGSFLTKQTTARNILQLLERANQGIRTREWTILSKEGKNGGTSMVLNLDTASMDALKARSFMLFGGVGGMATFKVPKTAKPKGVGGSSSPPEVSQELAQQKTNPTQETNSDTVMAEEPAGNAAANPNATETNKAQPHKGNANRVTKKPNIAKGSTGKQLDKRRPRQNWGKHKSQFGQKDCNEANTGNPAHTLAVEKVVGANSVPTPKT